MKTKTTVHWTLNKNYLMMVMISALVFIDAHGQRNRMIVGNQMINFGSSVIMSSLPQPAIPNSGCSNDYNSSITANRAQNIVSDPNGNLLFFIIDGNIFGADGAGLDYVDPVPPQGVSEYVVVPNPGNCQQFYIIWAQAYFTIPPGEATPYYGIFDLTLASPCTPNRSGSFVHDLSGNYAYQLHPNNWGGHNTNLHFAVSKLRSDGTRFLFFNDHTSVYKSIINTTGITQGTDIATIVGSSFSPLERNEMELFENPGNTGYLLGMVALHTNVDDVVHIISLDNSGNYVSMMQYFYTGIDLGYNEYIKGLEFSPDGQYLYFTQQTSPYLQYMNTTSGVVNALSMPAGVNAQDFWESQIELGADGKMYFAANNRVATLSNPNTPSASASNWNNSAFSVSVPLTNPNTTYAYPILDLRLLCDQVDGESEQIAPSSLSPECCEFYTHWDQRDINFIVDNSIPIWTGSSNPLNSNSGNVAWIEGTLTIPAGVDITIHDMIIHFGMQGKIIIQPGGKLTIQGTTLTGNGHCETMWQGVEVQGNPNAPSPYLLSDQGQFYMDDSNGNNYSVIEYALIGVAAQTIPDPQSHNYINQGGHFELNGGVFINNSISVYAIEPGVDITNSESQINRCDFKGQPPYLWYPYSGMKPRMFVDLYKYTGNDILFGYTVGAPINNRFNDGGYGIIENETYNVDITGCQFDNLSYGIYATQSNAISSSDLNILGCTFEHTFTCISMTGLTKFYITDGNTFNMDGASQDANYYGILLRGGAGNYLIKGNYFNHLKRGITILDDAPQISEIYDNEFHHCWRGLDLFNRQTNLMIKCNKFFNTFSAGYSVAVGNFGCLANQLNGTGAGNEFYNLPNRFDIVSVSPPPTCNPGPINFIYYAYADAYQTPIVSTPTILVQPQGPMQSGFCSTPMIHLMELADNNQETAQQIITQEEDPVKQQLWVSELVQWYRTQSQDADAANYLAERNDEPARKMLLPLYIELAQYDNAESLNDEYNINNDDESQNYYLLNKIFLGWAQSGRNAYKMNSTEHATLEQIGQTQTTSAAQAKDILRFVFDTVFIESNYGDTSYFRMDYYGFGQDHLFSLQPNPASDICTVHYVSPDDNNSASMNLFDVTGRIMQNWKLLKGSNEIAIDTKKYGNGIYILEYSLGNDFNEIQKLVIQKQR